MKRRALIPLAVRCLGLDPVCVEPAERYERLAVTGREVAVGQNVVGERQRCVQRHRNSGRLAREALFVDHPGSADPSLRQVEGEAEFCFARAVGVDGSWVRRHALSHLERNAAIGHGQRIIVFVNQLNRQGQREFFFANDRRVKRSDTVVMRRAFQRVPGDGCLCLMPGWR